MRARFIALTLVGFFCLDGCALHAQPEPRPPVAELLLVGFSGTEVIGNEEIRHLVCDVKVGGVILFERDGVAGGPRNMVSPGQIRCLTLGLQNLARGMVGPTFFFSSANAGVQGQSLSVRLSL